MSPFTSFVLSVVPCVAATPWTADLERQPVHARPALEVRYTSGARDAFEIEAEEYRLIGELRAPHRLVDADNRDDEWLWFELRGPDGATHASRSNPEPSRINLYRRGPYFCEIHWLDVRLADANGALAPLKGDL
ncbi:MAG: hypothetical protein JXR94_23285, partial [Candidatus Hydrogenedentes bacterium]|nr:hypothetical protein [Candidatus Hydrogenedentota bacterium]